MIRFFRSLLTLTRNVLSVAAPAAIFGLHLGVMLCFINRWDSMVIVTLIPIWAWAGLGMALSLLLWCLLKSRLLILTFVIWMATGIFCADESPGLYRAIGAPISGGSESDADPSGFFRIVTINCTGGDLKAAAVAGEHDPDVVFLQESSYDDDGLQELANEIFEGGGGSFLRGGQCVILARGELTPVEAKTELNGVIAKLEAPGLQPLEVVNIHLLRAVPRRDLWNPETWNQLTAVRVANRRTLRKTVESLPSEPDSAYQIVGGDFGTPANDDIFRMLRSLGFSDSFRESGIGWGNTCSNAQPLFRIDQIWSSSRLESIRSRAVPNVNSDHRMVISDFENPK